MSLPLVLLHGWGLDAGVWAPLRTALGTGREILTPSLPGHGTPAPATTRIDEWSNALLAGLPERFALCGWSLGALITLDLAARHPTRVARIALLGATPSFVTRSSDSDSGNWQHGLAPTTVNGFCSGFAADPAASLKRFVALQALGDARRRTVSTLLSAALADVDSTARAPLARALAVLAGADLRDRIASIRQPACLVHGLHDALMPVAAARWLAEHLPDASLTVFDDCGHAPHLSRPAECATLLEGWMLD